MAKKAGEFKEGGDPRRNVESGPKKLARQKSGEPANRDFKKEHDSSSAGRVAAKANVSRYKAEQAMTVAKGGDELLARSWSLNEVRRHLTTSQRACASAEVIERLPDDAKGKAFKRKGADARISVSSMLRAGTDDQSLRMML